MTTIPNPTRYVLGFVFNYENDLVVLIQKAKPTWMAGRWNGVGGHIEAEESAHVAMQRECLEETGLDIPTEHWSHFADVEGSTHTIALFFARCPSSKVRAARKTTHEDVSVFGVDVLKDVNTLPNVRWMVQMALSFVRGEGFDEHFEIAMRSRQ